MKNIKLFYKIINLKILFKFYLNTKKFFFFTHLYNKNLITFL